MIKYTLTYIIIIYYSLNCFIYTTSLWVLGKRNPNTNKRVGGGRLPHTIKLWFILKNLESGRLSSTNVLK